MIPKSYPHTRSKPKAGPMNAAEKRHADRLVAKGCAVPLCPQAPSVHHEHRYGGLRNHKRVVPLCWDHHQGPEGRHSLGHEGFKQRYGIDCERLAEQEWAITQIRERDAA